MIMLSIIAMALNMVAAIALIVAMRELRKALREIDKFSSARRDGAMSTPNTVLRVSE